MSGDAEMECFGPASVYLRKPERERIESQNLPFDAKTAYFVTEASEMYLKGKLTKKEGGKATVEALNGKVRMKSLHFFTVSICQVCKHIQGILCWQLSL